MTEPLTPVQIEQKLRGLVTAITQTQVDLREMRLAETAAEIALKRAQVRASFAPDCPKVTRGSVTVADREAWIEAQCIVEWEVWRNAATLREIAVDATRARVSESQAVMSLNASVRQAYSLAGSHS